MSQHGKIARLLKQHGIELTKKLGQHFLVDDKALSAIARAVGADAQSHVVEIGSGIGNLTLHLVHQGGLITALEIDQRFEPVLLQRLMADKQATGHVEMRFEDAMEYDYRATGLQAREQGRRFLIAGNIPYQITSPLIMHILESGTEFESMVLMMQREVAERLAAGPGSRRNGTITIKVQYFCTIETLFDVGKGSFLPPPEVESRVLRFRRRPEALTPERREKFFQLVNASFAQRRKQMANSVAACGIGYTKPQVEEALTKLGKVTNARAEELGLEQFLALFELLETGQTV